MKPLPVAVLLAVLGVSPCAGAAERLDIVPGKVERSSAGLSGSFLVRPAASGIESGGSGGACLVFSPVRGGGASCRKDSDCGFDAPAFDHAYCLRPAEGSGPGRCWLRPAGGNYCLRSPTPLPLSRKILLPVDAAGRLQPVPPLAGWWRVHACLAGKAPRACGDEAAADKLLRDGPARRVRAR